MNYYRYLLKELEKITPFPDREIRDIVYHLTAMDIGKFLTVDVEDINLDEIFRRTNDIIQRRKAGEPLDYILERSFFMDIELRVNRSVLIPRPETEILVEEVLKHKPGRTIDIGTGSGNIAITLAKHGFSVMATDISKNAIEVAEYNAKLNGVNIEMAHCQFMEGIDSKTLFDYVVSNPPYVSQEEYISLDSSVKMEPYEAIVSPQDGFWHSLMILKLARWHLNRGGYIFLEISPLRANKYKEVALELGYVDVRLLKDLNGMYRVLKARWR